MNGLAFVLILVAALLLPVALTHPGFNGASALIVLLVVLATAITLCTTRKASQ